MPLLEHAPGDLEGPPFFRTWPRVYTVVLAYLALLLILLYAATRAFHY